MAEENSQNKKAFSADWLVRGVLTKFGDAFDRFTGRGWKPSSSLATSELAEKLKALVDAEVRESEDHLKYVPHNIKLKTQWDKFSTDSEESIRTLEVELLTALIDHINDRRYHTYAPLSLTVKPDYFTTGVKLYASFDLPGGDEREMSVDIPGHGEEQGGEPAESAPETGPIRLHFEYQIAEKPFDRTLELKPGERLTVGRTRESDLAIDDPSVSKMHSSLVLNRSGELLVSDTGSTNGTFVEGERIAYGKALPLLPGQKLRFGTVDVQLTMLEKPVEIKNGDVEDGVVPATESYTVGEFEFAAKNTASIAAEDRSAAKSTRSQAPVTAVLNPPKSSTDKEAEELNEEGSK